MLDETVPATLLQTVLVVDDEPQVVWVLQFSLEAEGYTTYAAANGAEALAEISEHHPHLMVLDIMMPTMDGWAVLEEMLKLPVEQRPRVVIVSASRRCAIGRRPRSSAPTPTPQAVQRRRPAPGAARPRASVVALSAPKRWCSFGTTVVPTALNVRIGSSRNSAALSPMSVRDAAILWISNSQRREVFPTLTIFPRASIQSPAYSGARNSTDSYARNSPSSPSYRIASSVIRSPTIFSWVAPATRLPP